MLLLGTSLACLFGLPNVYTVLHRDKHDIECFSFVCCVCVCGRLDDALNYSEPWPWMHPPRHALGALLIEQGHYHEAEAVYRADLGLTEVVPRCAQHRSNVWALHGLFECLTKRGETEECAGLQIQLDRAMAAADTPIMSSCCCRKHTTPT